MAEREITIQNEICSNCSASTDCTWVIKNLYRCKLASLELRLGRIPTAKDIKEKADKTGLEKLDVDCIPCGCPNDYRSPENLPLR